MHSKAPYLICLGLCLSTQTSRAADPGFTMPDPSTLSPDLQMIMNLGAAGLLTKLASFEEMSVTQGRLGASRAQLEFSRVSAIQTGYQDSTDVFVLPLDAFYSLPNSRGSQLLRSSVIYGRYDAQSGDLTEVDTHLKRVDLQYFYSPNIDTLFGLGGYYEVAESELQHLAGSLDRSGYGLRADALKKLSANWGVALRADIGSGSNDTDVPVGPGTTLSYELEDTRLYFQADLVGSYTNQQLSYLPPDWVLRPQFALVYQDTQYDPTLSNFGTVISGTAGSSEQYSTAAISARLESTNYRPKALIPYFEFGIERELSNDVDAVLRDPNIVHTVAGATVLLGLGSRLDLQYSRHDGLDKLRKDQALVLHLGLSF